MALPVVVGSTGNRLFKSQVGNTAVVVFLKKQSGSVQVQVAPRRAPAHSLDLQIAGGVNVKDRGL